MQLFVIRHGTAVPRGPGIRDASRPLTRQGRQRWLRAVRGLERLGLKFDRLYHSPWLRAVETAEPLAALVSGESIVSRALARRPTPALLAQLEGERVAVVGHQPWLGELVGILVFGDAGAGARFDLKKGSVVWLEGTPRAGGMALRGVLPPRMLRALADSSKPKRKKRKPAAH
jgi:phosphohistidine phosphatase